MRLADLKRLPVGTKLKLVRSLMGPTPPEKQDRTVLRHQSNAVVMAVAHKGGAESFLYHPKASELRTEPNGFSIVEPNGEVSAQYEYAPTQLETTSSPTAAGGAL